MDLRVQSSLPMPAERPNQDVNAEDDEFGPDSPSMPDLEDVPLDEKSDEKSDGGDGGDGGDCGIRWDVETNSIVGTFNPILAVRVLRTYMLPESVELRQEYRKQHRDDYWKELSEIERTTMTEWAVCDYCGETSWCIRRSRAANLLANSQCYHCFNMEEV